MLLEKLTVSQLVRKLLNVYGSRKLITVFTKPGSGPYPEGCGYKLHRLAHLGSVLIFSYDSHVLSSLEMYAFLTSFMRATCSAHVIHYNAFVSGVAPSVSWLY